MTRNDQFGALTGAAVGIVMRDIVRRVIDEIRRQRLTFEARPKAGYSGSMDDLVTTADKAAQLICVKLITECFPGYGILAEEDDLRVESTHPSGAYFTIDPLDGTKAFARRQSHGVGTMLALVVGMDVVGVVIGDVMTQEMYYYRPGSDKVHRISEFRQAEHLSIDETRTLQSQYVLLRDLPDSYSPAVQRFIDSKNPRPPFAGCVVADGSIGISMARLWKGEVGAAILRGSHRTPWDETPVLGISRKLGFVSLSFSATTGRLSVIDVNPPRAVVVSAEEVLVVHRSRLTELGITDT